MKKLILLIFLISHVLLFSQNYRWEVIHGSQNRNESIRSLTEDYDKGLLVTGVKQSDNEDDGWLFKTDVNGEMLYDKIFTSGEQELFITGVANDFNGNKYICGTFWEDVPWPFIMKLDSCGNTIWCTAIRDDDFDWGGASDVFVINENMIILHVGYINLQDLTNLIHLIAFDADGNRLWMKPYASIDNYPLMETPNEEDMIEFNGNYYIAGHCYYPFPHNPNHMWLRPLFIGIDSLFNETFVIPFMHRDSIFGMAFTIIPINDSTLMGVGGTYIPPDYTEVGISLMFFNTKGDELGIIRISNDDIAKDIEIAVASSIEKVNDSLYIAFAGWSFSPYDNQRGQLIIDTSGNVYDIRRDSVILIATLIKTSDDNYVVGGDVRQNNSLWTDIIMYKINDSLESVPFDTTQRVYDSLCPRTIQSGSIDLYECLTVVNIGELPSPQEYYESIRWIPIKAYPNPVTEGKLTLEFDNTRHHQNMELHCYDNFGRLIHSRKIYNGQQDTVLDVSTWPPGIYIAVVYSDGSARGKVKFVIK
jgi:hypothetical protein